MWQRWPYYTGKQRIRKLRRRRRLRQGRKAESKQYRMSMILLLSKDFRQVYAPNCLSQVSSSDKVVKA